MRLVSSPRQISAGERRLLHILKPETRANSIGSTIMHDASFFPNEFPIEERASGKLRGDARVSMSQIFFAHRRPGWNPDYRRASVDEGERAPRLSLLAPARSLPARTGEDAR
jgi:hypothetical protein